MEHTKSLKPYAILLGMAAMHGVAMYLLMFSMINTGADFVHNLNFLYMAGLMTAPMMLLEVVLMRKMYPDMKVNLLVIGIGILMLIGFFFLIRTQGAVGDEAFLESMIPHHSGAILMCREASLKDPEVRSLCGSIIEGQQQEIEQMQAILERLGS